jgi:predicted HicB family RNase H-like nuclease
MKKTTQKKLRGEIHIRIPPELHELIAASAKINRRNINAEITLWLEAKANSSKKFPKA